jgi:hypothetical protein
MITYQYNMISLHQKQQTSGIYPRVSCHYVMTWLQQPLAKRLLTGILITAVPLAVIGGLLFEFSLV